MAISEQEAFLKVLSARLIDRRKEAGLYHEIHRHQNMLKEFFRERAGLNFIVHPEFIKLEKPSPAPQPWMGIEEFTETRDYVLLCCVLAFLEYKGAREQFLLGELVSYLPTIYPADELASSADPQGPLNWELAEHRRSLVRVLKHCIQEFILSELDGRTQDFSQTPGGEVLYESSRHASYYLMSYPKDITHLHSLDDAVQQMLKTYASDESELRRHRILRTLLLGPGYSYLHGPAEDTIYLRNQANRLESEFQKKSPFHFEISQDYAALTLDYRPIGKLIFPDQRAMTDVVLELSRLLRESLENGKTSNRNGMLELTQSSWNSIIQTLATDYRDKMSQTMQSMSLDAFANEVYEELQWLGVIQRHDTHGTVLIDPMLSRCMARPTAGIPTAKQRVSHERNRKKSKSQMLENEPPGLF